MRITRRRHGEFADEVARLLGVVNRSMPGLSKEEKTGGNLAATTRDGAEGEGVLAAVQDAATHGKEAIGDTSIVKTMDEKRREGEKAQSLAPGPLDRMADDAAQAATQKSKSWTSWITGR